MINPIHSTSLSEHSLVHYNKQSINDKIANNMPNGLQRVSEIKHNERFKWEILKSS